MLISSMLH